MRIRSFLVGIILAGLFWGANLACAQITEKVQALFPSHYWTIPQDLQALSQEIQALQHKVSNVTPCHLELQEFSQRLKKTLDPVEISLLNKKLSEHFLLFFEEIQALELNYPQLHERTSSLFTRIRQWNFFLRQQETETKVYLFQLRQEYSSPQKKRKDSSLSSVSRVSHVSNVSCSKENRKNSCFSSPSSLAVKNFESVKPFGGSPLEGRELELQEFQRKEEQLSFLLQRSEEEKKLLAEMQESLLQQEKALTAEKRYLLDWVVFQIHLLKSDQVFQQMTQSYHALQSVEKALSSHLENYTQAHDTLEEQLFSLREKQNQALLDQAPLEEAPFLDLPPVEDQLIRFLSQD